VVLLVSGSGGAAQMVDGNFDADFYINKHYPALSPTSTSPLVSRGQQVILPGQSLIVHQQQTFHMFR
jgi:hypothetical protein